MWEFINKNRGEDPQKLRLKYHGKEGEYPFDLDFAITQIECRRKYAKKFAETLERAPLWIFPSQLAAEQATSDRLARYHAALAGEAAAAIDLTAGLGIDSWHLAQRAAVTAVEIDPQKAEALRTNAGHIGVEALQVVNADCHDYLRQCREHYDVAFIDPARRGGSGERVFALCDCRPDVVQMLPEIQRVACRLIIKMSPMLDITAVAAELPGVCRITALGTPTECKELIAEMDFGCPAENHEIAAVTLGADTESSISFTQEEEAAATATSAEIGRKAYRYLFEPYPSVMKASPAKLLSRRFGIDMLHPNTRIYLSENKAEGFPGDVWEIEKILTFESKHIKRVKKEYPKLRVTARNFPFTAEQLRGKLGVSDGGEHRLFAVAASSNDKYMIIVKSTW